MIIKRAEQQIIIHAPYNTQFISFARNLAGKFDPKTEEWHFDIRDEADVLEACYFVYGKDGVRNNICDVKITLPNGFQEYQGTITFFGKQIARAFGRDTGAKLFSGIIIKKGGFTSGGSLKNWTTCAMVDTVFVLRDISRPLVEYSIEKNIYNGAFIEILPSVREKEQLEAERKLILERLAQINAELEG